MILRSIFVKNGTEAEMLRVLLSADGVKPSARRRMSRYQVRGEVLLLEGSEEDEQTDSSRSSIIYDCLGKGAPKSGLSFS